MQGCRRLGEGREPLFDSYHEALVYWANRFGAMSVDVEFGAYIFRATPETSPPVYFMGETYKGGEFLRRDTVANGLIMGLVTGIAVSVFSRLPFNKLSTSDSKKERVTISIIGFAHTRPVGHWARSNPSEEDRRMRREGNRFGVGRKTQSKKQVVAKKPFLT